MNLIEESTQIPEMYILRNKHTERVSEHGFDYQDNLIKRSVSPMLYNNENTSAFLDKLSLMMFSIVEAIQPVKNIFFYSHDKTYNRHGK